MFILTSLLMTLIYLAWHVWTAIGVAGDARYKRNVSEDVFKWAQEHEDEWINGTDAIVRENGKLMYYPHIYDDFFGHEVHYGWNTNHSEYGLVYGGRVVYNYENILWAKASGNRVQYKDGKQLINLGPKRGTWADVYKVVGEDKYYCQNKEVWMMNKGTTICKFTDINPNRQIYSKTLKEIYNEIMV